MVQSPYSPRPRWVAVGQLTIIKQKVVADSLSTEAKCGAAVRHLFTGSRLDAKIQVNDTDGAKDGKLRWLESRKKT